MLDIGRLDSELVRAPGRAPDAALSAGAVERGSRLARGSVNPLEDIFRSVEGKFSPPTPSCRETNFDALGLALKTAANARLSAKASADAKPVA
jgi:hypothetical protein